MNKILKKILSGFNIRSISSKLRAALFFVCLISILITGAVSYTSAQNALYENIYGKLTSLRIRQAQDIESYFKKLNTQVLALSEFPFVINAFKEMRAGYQKLESQPLPPEKFKRLSEFHETEVFPKFDRTFKPLPLLDVHLPQSSAGRYLQYEYSAQNAYPFNEKEKLVNANDGSDYSQAHAKFHPRFKRVLELFDYYDIWRCIIEV
jgi:hypothetical protein